MYVFVRGTEADDRCGGGGLIVQKSPEFMSRLTVPPFPTRTGKILIKNLLLTEAHLKNKELSWIVKHCLIR